MIIRLLKIFFLIILLNSNANSQNNVYIELKIDNEVITNIDIRNEKNYLIALNNNLKEISENNMNILAKNSLIKEKIKEKELLKYYDFNKVESVMEQIIEDIYKKLNFNNLSDFKKYLSDNNLNIMDINEKLKN